VSFDQYGLFVIPINHARVERSWEFQIFHHEKEMELIRDHQLHIQQKNLEARKGIVMSPSSVAGHQSLVGEYWAEARNFV
jgi:hypothetical protein